MIAQVHTFLSSSPLRCDLRLLFFFFNDTATTEIYTLSLHDALPISQTNNDAARAITAATEINIPNELDRSEEHTSELQSLTNLVCRLLLEKKKKHRFGVGCKRETEPERNAGGLGTVYENSPANTKAE